MALVDDVVLDHEVVVQKLSAVQIVGIDAPDLRGSQKHVFKLLFRKKIRYRLFIAQVELLAAAKHEVFVAEPTMPR